MRNLILFLILVALNVANAQERPSYIIKDSVSQHFTADIQDNLYVWQGYTLTKYNAQGQLLFRYSNPSLGNLQQVNADNPLKILLFYADAGILLFLDGKLAPIGNQLNLFEHNLNTISLVSFSAPNQIILFDERNKNLIITDLDLNIINKTPCTFEHFAPTELQVVKGKTILLNNPADGVYFFDMFGSYNKRLSIPDMQQIKLIGDQLYYLSHQHLWCYNILKLDRTAISLPNKLPIKQFYVTSSSFWLFDKEGIFSIKDPSVLQ